MQFNTLVFGLFFLCVSQNAFSSIQSDTLIVAEINVTTKNTKTKPSVIMRELTFAKGDLMSLFELVEYEIPQSINNIKNLNLFNHITIEPVVINETIVVNIEVIEKWYLWPIPYVEFADRNINQWSTFDFDPYRTNFGLYVFKYNLFGLNHTLKATIGTGYTDILGFEYAAPYIGNDKKFGFTIDVRNKSNNEIRFGVSDDKEQFFRSKNTAMFTEFSGVTELTYRPGLYTRHGLSVNHNQIHIADTVVTDNLNPEFLFNNLSNQQLTTFAYHISYDNRNNKLFPLIGIYADVGASITLGDAQYASVGFDLNFYRPLPVNRMYSALSYKYQDALNSELPYVLNKAVGVKNNVRGYEKYMFLGDQFAILRAELRYLIIPERDITLRYMPVKQYKTMPIETYISAFYDQAQIINDGFQRDIYGFGVGINTLLYYDKVFRFEYSWNHWNRSGLKIHFKKAF
ncbi:MAG: outer membrane protein assembly factor BamA [Bacteroidia bacterium]